MLIEPNWLVLGASNALLGKVYIGLTNLHCEYWAHIYISCGILGENHHLRSKLKKKMLC